MGEYVVARPYKPAFFLPSNQISLRCDLIWNPRLGRPCARIEFCYSCEDGNPVIWINMKISERTIKRLGEIITGDKKLSPYRSGPELCKFFNELGTNHVYAPGFPSRWSFAEQCIREF